MSLIARVKSWLRVSGRRADFEREMQDEMRIHAALSVLGVVTMVAGYMPARQASRIDPVRALRAE